jgi:hypothetical protein
MGYSCRLGVLSVDVVFRPGQDEARYSYPREEGLRTLSETSFDRAATFLRTQARRLELSLFEFHFIGDEDSKAVVVEALRGYQNHDGGFGRALEPDVRMQDSSVVATKYALQILVDIQASDQEELVQDGVAYLLDHYDQKKQAWPLVTDEVMDAPHAPWWDIEGLEEEFGSFLANPKAGIVRCLLEYRQLVPGGFLDDVLHTLMAHFEALPIEMEFFDAISFLQLLQSNHLDDDHRERLLSKLKLTGRRIVNRDPGKWLEFAVKPLWLAPSPFAPLAGILEGDVQRNLDFEIGNQNKDGSWSPSWSWGASCPESWEAAEKEWKSILTLAMLRSLRDFRRIDGCPLVDWRPAYKYHID